MIFLNLIRFFLNKENNEEENDQKSKKENDIYILFYGDSAIRIDFSSGMDTSGKE